VELNFTTPLLAALAVVNAVAVLARAPRRVHLVVSAGIVGLAAVLLKDWLQGLIYLTSLP
jgi:hypothetical protein